MYQATYARYGSEGAVALSEDSTMESVEGWGFVKDALKKAVALQKNPNCLIGASSGCQLIQLYMA